MRARQQRFDHPRQLSADLAAATRGAEQRYHLTYKRTLGLELMKAGRFMKTSVALAAMATPMLAFAQSADPVRWQLNMGRGVTPLSNNAYDAHMLALWICLGIGVAVFIAMGIAMFRFRKSRGAVADTTFVHNTRLEIVWTVIPVILLVVMAAPATTKLVKMYDHRDSEMTVKVTGYQWMWEYEYLGEDVSFVSRLDREHDRIRQSGVVPGHEDHPTYLLEVDNELVLPVDTKVRFVITADDVIHSWWVPALGWKQDAVPGIINEAWADIDTPGIYRGQCAELCGKDHGFMPIVVRALPKAEFQQWLASKKAAGADVANAVPQSPRSDTEITTETDTAAAVAVAR
ncbi:Cytochrome c oxidase polypeptide II [Lysobacter sp. A03]|nr:Cytochrome c oxidase polypeptide II [Lysobacter sp. A03]